MTNPTALLHVFLHIPKTSGSTIREYLKPHFGEDEAIFYYKRDGFRKHAPILQGMVTPQTKLVFGHFPFGLHQLLDRPVQYHTVLRNPIARVISFYRFAQTRSDDDASGHKQLIANAKNCSILEFCELHTNVFNQQCAYLSPDAPEDVDAALKNLEAMHFGLQDFTALFLKEMSQTLGVGPVVFKNRKVRKYNGAITTDELRQLHEKCHLDNALFQRAKKIFLARQSSSEFGLKLKNTLIQRSATFRYRLFNGR